jgi:hypothetical protein
VQLANEIADALDLFWMGLVFGVAPTPGTVITVVGRASFVPGLTALWTPPHVADRSANASATATLLATYTTPLMITVQFPGPVTFFVV